MALETEIRAALETLSPTALKIINESSQHQGHAGDDGSGESHWRVVITAAQFADMSRIARHRAIHAALGPDLIGRIHALAIDIET
ncbi:BolA family protein [Yoonia sp. SS1-5]|uniref:BolA family protein n=1 Tax=Yoonia rhodophyticola TaxID=3137370 RepID=A0AAN0MBY5_9RHOB